jgi:hypothetical protein
MLRNQRNLLGSKRNPYSGIRKEGIGKNDVHHNDNSMTAKRRRIISEVLTYEEQEYFRKETDMAHPISFNSLSRKSNNNNNDDDDDFSRHSITDTRTITSGYKANREIAKKIENIIYEKDSDKNKRKKTIRRTNGKDNTISNVRNKNNILSFNNNNKRQHNNLRSNTNYNNNCDYYDDDNDDDGDEKMNQWERMMEKENMCYNQFGDGMETKDIMCMVSSMDWVKTMEMREFENQEIGKKEQEPMRVEDAFVIEHANDDKLDGDAIVDLWFESLSKIEENLTLSQQQKDFINSCFISLLPLMYKEQFDINIVRLTKRYNIDAIFKKIFFEMPRRFGKTTSTSIVAAITAYIIPSLTVGIYSIVKSASDSLVESSIEYYETISGMDKQDFVVEWNKTKGRVVLKNAHGNTSTIWGYSAVSTVNYKKKKKKLFIYFYLFYVYQKKNKKKKGKLYYFLFLLYYYYFYFFFFFFFFFFSFLVCFFFFFFFLFLLVSRKKNIK